MRKSIILISIFGLGLTSCTTQAPVVPDVIVPATKNIYIAPPKIPASLQSCPTPLVLLKRPIIAATDVHSASKISAYILQLENQNSQWLNEYTLCSSIQQADVKINDGDQ